MKVFFICALMCLLSCDLWSAEPRRVRVEWSDGKKAVGEVSLSPGKDIRIYSGDALRTVRLEDIQELQMNVEKEEMFEGFTFPEAGKAIKEKTGEVYPVRHFQTRLVLYNGKTIEGHLYTTTLYFEVGGETQKIVLFAKTKGVDGQKLSDLVYPSKISFIGESQSSAYSLLELTKSDLQGIKKVMALSKPELTLLEVIAQGDRIWRIPFGDSRRLIIAAECADGLHVAWPESENEEARKAVEASLKDMTDFYDTVKILGSFTENENTDVYTLALLSREEKTHSFSSGKIPWTVAVLRWKYDPDEKKTTLLNRMQLTTGRVDEKRQFPPVIKDASLLKLLKSVAAETKEAK